VLAEPGRLLDQQPSFLWLRVHDLLDLALADHRVHLPPEAGVRQRIGDVGKPAVGAVQAIATLTLAVEATRYRDLGELGAGRPVGVVDHDLDLGRGARRSLPTPREDHVLHRLAANGERPLLAERPQHTVGDVGLPAAVRTDDHADARGELELGALGEGLEALQGYRLEVHLSTCRLCP
jgi:hypothetical protein